MYELFSIWAEFNSCLIANFCTAYKETNVVKVFINILLQLILVHVVTTAKLKF